MYGNGASFGESGDPAGCYRPSFGGHHDASDQIDCAHGCKQHRCTEYRPKDLNNSRSQTHDQAPTPLLTWRPPRRHPYAPLTPCSDLGLGCPETKVGV